MNYEILFQVSPPGWFGLPEPDRVVIKGNSGQQITGPVIDRRSGNLVSHGTLSRYRTNEEAIDLELEVEGSRMRVWDNFFSLRVEAADQGAALSKGRSVFDRYLRLVMTQQGDLFEYEILQIESEDGVVDARPQPQAIRVMNMTVFNLEQLRIFLAEAARRSSAKNERLDKALVYYEHARLFFRMRGLVPIFSTHQSFILASAYLNLWKAISVVLGEPGTDSDYQKRFRDIGFDTNFWKEKIQPLLTVRNDHDVAHYSLDATAVGAVDKNFGNAEAVCRTVLNVYADYALKTAETA